MNLTAAPQPTGSAGCALHEASYVSECKNLAHRAAATETLMRSSRGHELLHNMERLIHVLRCLVTGLIGLLLAPLR